MLHVIELLRPIGISDVTPVFRPDAVVVVIVRCNGGPLARGIGVPELRQQRVPLQNLVFWEVEKLNEGGINIQQLGRASANLPLADTRPRKYERDAGAIIPKGILAGNFLLPDVVSVVRPEDYDRIFFQPGLPESVEDALDLGIDCLLYTSPSPRD